MKRYVWLVLFLVAGTFLMQGFQCASPEMTSGKLAARNKDWDKAEASFEKEVSKNPTNGEAWILLAEVRTEKGNLKGAAEALVESDKNIQDPKLKTQASLLKNKLWTETFNSAVQSYNDYFSSQDKAALDAAEKNLDVAVMLKPDMPVFYSVQGSVYEMKGDTANAIKSYNKYSDLVDKDMTLARNKNIFVNMPRTDALKNMGAPVSSKGIRYSPDSDSLITDEFNVDGKEVYMFSYEKDGVFQVHGWKVDPPKSWLQPEREQPVSVSTSPFASLAQFYFDRKDYEKSLKNVMKILILDPTNVDANNFMVAIYEAQGDKNAAVNYIKGLVDKNPGNKYFRAQYGDILLQTEQYDEAIQQYQEALKIDPGYGDVMKTLAAAYKNKAVLIQKNQKEKKDKDPKYVEDTKEYFPLLQQSEKYFEESRKYGKNSSDIYVLGELANLYDVLDQKDKLKVVTAELEGLEFTVPENKKEAYYLTLLRIYDRLKLEDKLKQVQQKLDQLNKQ